MTQNPAADTFLMLLSIVNRKSDQLKALAEAHQNSNPGEIEWARLNHRLQVVHSELSACLGRLQDIQQQTPAA